MKKEVCLVSKVLSHSTSQPDEPDVDGPGASTTQCSAQPDVDGPSASTTQCTAQMGVDGPCASTTQCSAQMGVDGIDAPTTQLFMRHKGSCTCQHCFACPDTLSPLWYTPQTALTWGGVRRSSVVPMSLVLSECKLKLVTTELNVRDGILDTTSWCDGNPLQIRYRQNDNSHQHLKDVIVPTVKAIMRNMYTHDPGVTPNFENDVIKFVTNQFYRAEHSIASSVSRMSPRYNPQFRDHFAGDLVSCAGRFAIIKGRVHLLKCDRCICTQYRWQFAFVFAHQVPRKNLAPVLRARMMVEYHQFLNKHDIQALRPGDMARHVFSAELLDAISACLATKNLLIMCTCCDVHSQQVIGLHPREVAAFLWAPEEVPTWLFGDTMAGLDCTHLQEQIRILPKIDLPADKERLRNVRSVLAPDTA